MKNLKLILLAAMLVVALAVSSCTQASADKKGINKTVLPNNIKRYGSVTGLKPGKLEYYKNLHAHAWPGVLKMIGICHIQNYTIYLQKIDNKYFLFSYFEYTGKNFDEDMKKMAADSITKKWWKETGPCQLPLPEARNKNAVWTSMEEVFHEN